MTAIVNECWVELCAQAGVHLYAFSRERHGPEPKTRPARCSGLATRRGQPDLCPARRSPSYCPAASSDRYADGGLAQHPIHDDDLKDHDSAHYERDIDRIDKTGEVEALEVTLRKQS